MGLAPRPLQKLTDLELRAYAQVCRSTIRHNRDRLQVARLKYGILSRNKRRDSFLTYGGAALAVLGIVTTPLFTPLGAAALVGGGMSLLGLGDQHEKVIERSHLRTDIENIEVSDLFCESELRRIQDEMKQRGSP